MGVDPRELIRKRSVYLGFDPFIPDAVSVVESGGGRSVYGDVDDPRDGIDPRSILGPDGRTYYTSLGPFQERVVGGAGETHLRGGGSLADLFDPVGATDRFIARFKRAAEVAPIDATPGQIAAAAQRPKDQEGYAFKVDRLIGQLRASVSGVNDPVCINLRMRAHMNDEDIAAELGMTVDQVRAKREACKPISQMPPGTPGRPVLPGDPGHEGLVGIVTAPAATAVDGLADQLNALRTGAAQLAIAAGVIAVAGILMYSGIRKTLG